MNHLIGATLLASLVILLLGYFLGCLNGSVMVSHFIIKDDVRQHGSGNAGLTNFYRTYGAKYALGVILFDMGKTVVAGLIREASDTDAAVDATVELAASAKKGRRHHEQADGSPAGEESA